MDRLSPNSNITGIPAATWNQFVDSAKSLTQLPGKTDLKGSRGAQALRLLVRNDTGSAITAAFPVLAISTPVITTADRESCIHEGIQFVGSTPDSDSTKPFAIVQGPIPEDTFRPAIFQGLSWCRLNYTDTTHTKAHVGSTSDYLDSGTSGAPILWRELQDESDEDSLGEQWAIVLLGGGSGGGTSVDVDLVLIDEDIDPVIEDDPASVLTADDIELTEDEDDDGVVVVLENPPGTEVESLDLKGVERGKATLKRFVKPAEGWPGFDADLDKLVLATTITDEPGEGEDPPRKIIRYAFKDYFFDDLTKFEVGSWGEADYPDYEGDWPPPAVEDPDTFFKKAWVALAVGGVLFIAFCKVRKKPDLPEEE